MLDARNWGGLDHDAWLGSARPLEQGRGWLWWTRSHLETVSVSGSPFSKHRWIRAPFGADAPTALLNESAWDEGSLWLVASTAARDHWRDRFTRDRAIGLARPRPDRVWDFAEVWNHIGQALPDPPGRLSEIASLALINECLEIARRRDLLKVVQRVMDTSGYRDALRDRFRLWTLGERSHAPDPAASEASIHSGSFSEFDHAAEQDAFTLFQLYRQWLEGHHLEDAAGWVVWASRGLERHPEAVRWQLEPDTVAVIDPPASGPATRRVLTFLRDHARRLEVVLPDDPEPSLNQPYRPWNALRERVRAWRFVERWVAPPADRPAGLAHLDSTLFRSDEHRIPRHPQTQGVGILGAPLGEAQGLVAAREAQRLHRQGVAWNQMLFLTRGWDEAADEWRRTLEACGVPLRSLRRETLAEKPVIRSVLRITRLIARQWRTEDVVACLRDRLVAPHETAIESDEPEQDPGTVEASPLLPSWLDRARAADAVAQVRLPGGLNTIRAGLSRMAQLHRNSTEIPTPNPPPKVEPEEPDQNDRFGRALKAQHARIALNALNWLVERLAPLTDPGTRLSHLDALEEVAEALGLMRDSDQRRDWDQFRLALEEDEAIVRITAEVRNEPLADEPWTTFVSRAEQVARVARVEPSSASHPHDLGGGAWTQSPSRGHGQPGPGRVSHTRGGRPAAGQPLRHP